MTPDLGEAAAALALAGLRDEVRGVLGRAWSPSRFRGLLDGDGPAFDEGLWSTVQSLGWCDVLVAEHGGGGGGSIAELCVLVEEAGAAGAPVPLGAAAVAAWCEDRCVDGMPLLLTGATGVRGDGPEVTVSGQWPLVRYGARADRLVLLAGGDDGPPSLAAVDAGGAGVERVGVTPLDRSPSAAVTLTGVPAEVVAEGPAATERWAEATRMATLATVAELVGVAAAANAAACAYAAERVAFGRPIGAFQAIKHRLVNQRAAIEVGRALVTRAAEAGRRGRPDADGLTSLATFWAIDALRAVPEGAIQVFGGIAYTWEHDAHGHLRRAACLVAALGPRASHRDRALRWLTARRS